MPQAKSTTTRLELPNNDKRELSLKVWASSLAMDTALPGKHPHDLYNKLNLRDACILAQLRTRMARLNGLLSKIGAIELDLRPYGQARKTVKHFVLRCAR